MVILNKEINRVFVLPVVGVILVIILAVSGWFISRRLTSSNLSAVTTHATESTDAASQSGSHNVCENNACVAKPGIGPSDCTLNIDCAPAECATVVASPEKPAIGDSNVKFICAGSVPSSSNTVATVDFSLTVPSTANADEFSCPSDNCTFTSTGSNFTATLTYPKALVKGSYSIMTRACFKLASGADICGKYLPPTP
ncbi:MAG: hypothetical protein NT141_02340 [candidate division WWE3 bacterium]|nr:hypothetical protein [candidate division WWE3 bacterium]